jgi:hypothetical protein
MRNKPDMAIQNASEINRVHAGGVDEDSIARHALAPAPVEFPRPHPHPFAEARIY